ncbi:MAG: head completion/stabilization protein [Bacillota bacterium]
MAGFVSSPPAPPASNEGDLAHDGEFYPGVNLALVRDTMRIPTQVTSDRLKAATIAAMLTVERDLAEWRALQAQARLGLVNVSTIGGENRLEALYRRAVYSFAAADLAETHSDVTATGDGKDRAEARVLTAEEHRRNGLHAIRDILGVGRTAVELI